MIQLIKGLPDAVVGLEAIGQVESTDYEAVAAPAVKQALERHQKIRLIHVLDDRATGTTTGGEWKDSMFCLAQHRANREREHAQAWASERPDAPWQTERPTLGRIREMISMSRAATAVPLAFRSRGYRPTEAAGSTH